jgi:hypothetical protein
MEADSVSTKDAWLQEKRSPRTLYTFLGLESVMSVAVADSTGLSDERMEVQESEEHP